MAVEKSTENGYPLGRPSERPVHPLDAVVEEAIHKLPPSTRLYPDVYAWSVADAAIAMAHAGHPGLNPADSTLTDRLALDPELHSTLAEEGEAFGRKHDIYDVTGRADVERLAWLLSPESALESRPHDLTRPTAMSIRRSGAFTIIRPTLTSDRRSRFAIAHELAHYELHYRRAGVFGYAESKSGCSDLLGVQANLFVAGLLMPSAEFTAAFERLRGNDRDLAARFDVSPMAAATRSFALGLGV